MTGFLNLDLLRAQEAPWFGWVDAGRGKAPRPRLVARWECASDGGLVCRWQTDDLDLRLSG
jgi:hypothetical protein